jgi:hypothetical protein
MHGIVSAQKWSIKMKLTDFYRAGIATLAIGIVTACELPSTNAHESGSEPNPSGVQVISGTAFVDKGVILEKGKSLEKQSQNIIETEIAYPETLKTTDMQKGSIAGYIQDAAIVASNSAAVSCPTGFLRVNIDLNRGSGGKFIYLCVTYDVAYRRIGISRFDLYNSGSKNDFRLTYSREYSSPGQMAKERYYFGSTWAQTNAFSLQREWQRISPTITDDQPIGPHYYMPTSGSSNGDLNQGASGDFIWLVGMNGEPSVRNVAIISGNSSAIACPYGYEKVDTTINGILGDLNRKAGGYFIFLCQQF